MATPNTSGKAKTEDYNLGRGIMYLAVLDATTQKPNNDGWRDIGNVNEFTTTITEETLDHFASRAGTKSLDAQITLSQILSGTFSVEEMNQENLALFHNGTVATVVNPAKTIQAKYTMVAAVKLGRWYDIEDALGGSMYDVETGNLVFEETAVLLIEGTDYELDLKMGRVFLLEAAANITDGDPLSFTNTADAGAVDTDEILGLEQAEQVFGMRFISKNPNNNNKQTQYSYRKVRLKSNGDQSHIGDDWSNLPFSFAAERNETGYPLDPVVNIATHANA